MTRGSLTSRRDENAMGTEKGTWYGWVSRVLIRHWSSTGVAMASIECTATVTTVMGIEVYRAQSFTRSLSAIYRCRRPHMCLGRIGHSKRFGRTAFLLVARVSCSCLLSWPLMLSNRTMPQQKRPFNSLGLGRSSF